jgi:hypothetical protein
MAWVVPSRSRPRRSRPDQGRGIASDSGGNGGSALLPPGAGGDGVEEVTRRWACLIDQCHRRGVLSHAPAQPIHGCQRTNQQPIDIGIGRASPRAREPHSSTHALALVQHRPGQLHPLQVGVDGGGWDRHSCAVGRSLGSERMGIRHHHAMDLPSGTDAARIKRPFPPIDWSGD